MDDREPGGVKTAPALNPEPTFWHRPLCSSAPPPDSRTRVTLGRIDLKDALENLGAR
jgi:hypothetical protein